MKYISLLFLVHFLAVLGNTGLCQRALADSLLVKMKGETPSEQLKTRVFLSDAYSDFDADSALYFARKNLKYSFDLRSDSSFIQSLSLIGLLHTRRTEFDTARYFHNQAIRWSQKLQLAELEARSRNNLAILAWTEGDMHAALDQMLLSLSIAKTNNYEGLIVLCTANAATLYSELGLNEQALFHYRESNELAKKMGEPESSIEAYLSMALCFDKLGQLDSAQYFLSAADSMNQQFQNRSLQARIYGAYGAISFSKNEYRKARDYTEQSLLLNEELQRLGQVDNQVNLSMMDFALGNYEAGLERAEIGEDFIEQGYIPGNEKDVYIYKALNLAALGNPEAAIRSYQQFLALNDSLFSEEKASAVSQMEVKYKLAEKESLILNSQKKAAQAEMELAQSRLDLVERNAWIALLLLALVAVAAVATVVYFLQKRKAALEKRRLHEAAQRKKIELMIELQEQERTRISKDLHDGVCQQLSGLKLAVDTLLSERAPEGPEALKKMSFVSQSLVRSMEQVRHISHNMMPKSLQEFGLVPALESLVETTFAHTNIDSTFEHHKANQRFDKAVELAMYRITQELLNNVIKHAQATAIHVQLIKSKTYLTLLVEDNGVGMPTEVRSGHGMANIDVRLSSIGGEVNFENAPDGGTLVMARVGV